LPQGIELFYSDTGVVCLVELVFYSFSEMPLWSYFRFITTATEPIGVLPREVQNAAVPSFSEFAYRTQAMHYSSSKGEGDPIKEKPGSKELIKNYNKGGDFVLFSSVSPFGKPWDKDASLHQRLGDKGFPAYIEEQVNGQMAVAE
jgi:hypothetical protein